MIRLESGGSDCTMEAGFRENSVYSAYTRNNASNFGYQPIFLIHVNHAPSLICYL